MSLPLWVQIVAALAPVLAVISASTAALIAWRSHSRQKRSDSEDRFWHRLTWAIEMAQADDIGRADTGVVVLIDLLQDKRLLQADTRLLSELMKTTANTAFRIHAERRSPLPKIEVVKYVPSELRTRYTDSIKQSR